MTTVSPYTALNTSSGAATGPSANSTKNETVSADRFLKLLVAQMENQDPLNPMDNAQVTSQMAQINTVSGIEKLNSTVESLSGQFTQLQVMQGASLVGRDVVLEGDRLSANDAGLPQGGFEMASAAESVKVEVLNGAGVTIDTIDLGARDAGRHGFEWTPKTGVDAADGERFRITAKNGTALVQTTALMRDRVDAVSTGGDALTLELRHLGSVAYGDVKAFN